MSVDAANPTHPFCTILVTCPDRLQGERIARELVSRRLAACVNLIDNITSIYHWQEGIVQDQETLLIIKSTSENYGRVEQAVHALHPYELPEVISLQIERGSHRYLRWIEESSHLPPINPDPADETES